MAQDHDELTLKDFVNENNGEYVLSEERCPIVANMKNLIKQTEAIPLGGIEYQYDVCRIHSFKTYKMGKFVRCRQFQEIIQTWFVIFDGVVGNV